MGTHGLPIFKGVTHGRPMQRSGCGKLNFGSKYLRFGSDFVQHIYTHSNGFFVSYVSDVYDNFKKYVVFELDVKM
jgi:hypothetical protein